MSTIPELRTQLVANGYRPVPSIDKRGLLKDWPNLIATPDAIDKWSRRHKKYDTTGVLVRDGLAVIDLDIDHDCINEIADRILDACPTLSAAYDNDTLCVRKGGGLKEAWFVRTDAKPFHCIHSILWQQPGHGEDDPAYRVEIFGGGSHRFFGAFGAHTKANDGTVLKEYRWNSRSLLDTPLYDLPLVTEAEFMEIAAIVDTTLRVNGFGDVKGSTMGKDTARWEYILTENMTFICDDGVTRNLEELERVKGTGMSCNAAFLEGPSARRPDRVHVNRTRDGKLCLFEFRTYCNYLREDAKPVERATIDPVKVADMFAKLGSRKAAMDNELLKGETGDDVVLKLLPTYAFCASDKAAVVPVWRPDKALILTAFKQDMCNRCEEIEGKRGAITRINPVDTWMNHEDRISIDGVRMDPNMPIPLYEEGSRTYVNAYHPVVHDTPGGCVDPALVYFEHLFPKPEQRHCVLQWLAYKYRNPGKRAFAMVMVALRQGAGRGTLFKFLKALFGHNYVVTLPYATVVGATYQSQYNEQQVTSLIVCVNESADSESGGASHKNRDEINEHLKDVVDPEVQEVLVVRKRDGNYMTKTYATYIFATNNRNALPLKADDRRFYVCGNGDPDKAGICEALVQWYSDPANLTAFAEYLLSYDMTGFKHNDPPMTVEKRGMIELAASPLDEAFETAMAELPGKVFVVDQVSNRMKVFARDRDLAFPGNWENVLRKMIMAKAFRIGDKNVQPLIDGGRKAVYCRTEVEADAWLGDMEGVREQVSMNGSTKPVTAAEFMASLNKAALKVVK